MYFTLNHQRKDEKFDTIDTEKWPEKLLQYKLRNIEKYM